MLPANLQDDKRLVKIIKIRPRRMQGTNSRAHSELEDVRDDAQATEAAHEAEYEPVAGIRVGGLWAGMRGKGAGSEDDVDVARVLLSAPVAAGDDLLRIWPQGVEVRTD